MSTTPQATVAAPQRQELKIISHSNLFYWWPVWAVGFLMGFITLIHGTLLAVVPTGTIAVSHIGTEKVGEAPKNVQAVRVGEQTGTFSEITDRTGLVYPEKSADAHKPYQHIANTKGPGVIFFTVLLLVIFITNVPLRGLWSVLVIVVIILAATLLSVFRVWDDVFDLLGVLDIRLSMAGYFFVSTVLLILWLIAFLFFDPKVYMIFSPGQIRYCLEIGDAEHIHDTTGMSVRKQRDDIFRHWVLGLGSGDLFITTGGTKQETFDLPNVLFVGGKLKQIEDLLRSRAVVAGAR